MRRAVRLMGIRCSSPKRFIVKRWWPNRGWPKAAPGILHGAPEMPIYELGLFDMFHSCAIAEASRKVEPLGEYYTGKQMPCNGAEPAANETMMILNDAHNLRKAVQTDAEGRLRLDQVLSGSSGAVALKVFPKVSPSDTISHKYLAETYQ